MPILGSSIAVLQQVNGETVLHQTMEYLEMSHQAMKRPGGILYIEDNLWGGGGGACPQHSEVPGPGTEIEPQQSPHQVLNC